MPEFTSESALAVVTGASRRVGKMLALALAQRGYHLIVHYHHNQDDALQTVQEIRSLGLAATALPADLSCPDEIGSLFTQVDEISGKVEILVNSAAVMPSGKLTAASVEDWSQVMDLNLRAPWLCTLAAAQRMPAGGLVINICDEFASQTWSRYPLYGLSKSSLEHLTRMLAADLNGKIRVNGLALGAVLPPAGANSEAWDRLVHRSRLKTVMQPALIGRMLDYFLENEYISGEILYADQIVNAEKDAGGAS